MKIKALKSEGEVRALEYGKSEAVDPSKVEGYLRRAFKDRYANSSLSLPAMKASNISKSPSALVNMRINALR